MRKNIALMNLLAGVLVIGIGLPAYAANEEDIAAPAGSFTSNIPVPAQTRSEEIAMRIRDHRVSANAAERPAFSGQHTHS